VHAGSGIGTAVAQQGEIKGMQRNTHDRRRTVSHRDGRAPERYRMDEVCGTRFVASYDGGCKCQHVKL
jgi:hypothetical protein